MPKGVLWSQFIGAAQDAADPNNPAWARGLLFVLGSLASPVAGAEELLRGGMNTVSNMGIGAGEHFGRSSLFWDQGDYGEAIEEGLFGVASESTAFVSAVPILQPYAAVAPRTPPAFESPSDFLAEEMSALKLELSNSLQSASTSTEASALFQARDQAAETARKIVQQELRDGWISPAQQQARFGTWLDALAKTNIRQAVVDARLPSTYVTSPTVSLSRGYLRSWISAPDVWDIATGRAWDFMAAREAAFYQHEADYLGTTAFGRLDPGGTRITEIFPLFHTGF